MKKLFLTIVVASLLVACQENKGSESASLDPISEFTIVNYNAYLLQQLGMRSFASGRYLHLVEGLVGLGPTIMTLQEVWDTNADFPTRLQAELKDAGFHSLMYLPKDEDDPDYSPLGNGMLIASRYALSDLKFEAWRTYTRKAETISRKGVMMAKAQIPGIGEVQIFNAHTSAKKLGPDGFRESDLVARIDQIRQVKDFMARQKTSSTRLQILGIDLNSHFFDWQGGDYTTEVAPEYVEMLNGSGLSSALTPDEHGELYTWDPANFWARSGFYPENPAAMLDYVFMSDGCCRFGLREVVLTDTVELATTMRDSKFAAPISDHYGLRVVVHVND